MSGFLTLLRHMIHSQGTNQETMIRTGGVATIGALLQKVCYLKFDLYMYAWMSILGLYSFKEKFEWKKIAYCKYEWKDVIRYYHMIKENLFRSLRKAVLFDSGTFLVLGESTVNRCERVDVGSVTGWDYSQCEPDFTEPVLPVPAVRLQNLEQQWISC